MASRHRVLLRFALVPVVVAVAMLIRVFLWHVLGPRLPFLLLWPVVLFAAWFGGLLPGLFATLLAALAEIFFIIEPRNSFTIEEPAEAAGVILFVLLGATVSLMAEWLHRSQRRLTEEYRHKDVFLATLAHELRNALAPLRNAVEILKMPRLDSKGLTEISAIVDRQVGQVARLVDDLLDLSRVAQGRLRLQPEWVDVAAVIAQAVETSRPLIDAKEHELTVSLPNQPVEIFADSCRVVQILTNLLNNAAKYTDPGGHITLTAAVQYGAIAISVRDTGVGIPQEQLPRVFEMFSQLKGSEGRAQGGLGIGLALVRGLVELHGGRVEALSHGLGKGSEFVVRIPLSDEDKSSCPNS